MQTKYDLIIIGCGPNGLCVAAYLSKAEDLHLRGLLGMASE